MNPITEFFAMGGYAFYVWTSFGVTACLLGGIAVWSAREFAAVRRRTFARALERVADAARDAAARGPGR